jgi:hypothetical protein
MEWNGTQPLLLQQAGQYAICCTAKCGEGPVCSPHASLGANQLQKRYPDTACAATPSITLGDLHCRQPDVQPYDLPPTHTRLGQGLHPQHNSTGSAGYAVCSIRNTHNHGQPSQRQATGPRSCVLGDKSHGKASLPTVQHQLQCQHADHALKVGQVCWTKPEESRHGLVRTCH